MDNKRVGCGEKLEIAWNMHARNGKVKEGDKSRVIGLDQGFFR